MGLISSTPNSGQEHPQSASEVIQTALLLRQSSIPADLVPYILDLAGYWTPVAIDSRNDGTTVVETTAGLTYLQVALPSWLPPRCVRRLRFSIDSKDQGWSSWTTHHGTYVDSWSWWEVCVVRRDRAMEESSDGDGETQQQPQWIMDDAARYRNTENRVWRTCVQHNVHAGRDFKEHHVEWVNVEAPSPMQERQQQDEEKLTSTDDEASPMPEEEQRDIQQMMWDLKGGDVIGLTVWARFPGWMNQVRGARIEVDAAVVKRM